MWVPHSAFFRGVRVSNSYWIACVWLSEAANSPGTHKMPFTKAIPRSQTTRVVLFWHPAVG